MTVNENDLETGPILPRESWWWLGLAILLLLAAWLYLRGYNVSLPFFAHGDEVQHILAAQHIIDFGWENGVHEQYPPGAKTLSYLLLKHIKPAEAHHGTMLPTLRLITIAAWMLVVVFVTLLGTMIIHPMAGLMAAAIWIVNPWVVERAHWLLPDGYLTLFTLLALWLALVGYAHRRRSFSTAAVYSIMLATVFKTQALFVAPIIVLMPLLNWRRRPARRQDAFQQTVWNCLRFAIFLFWLLLIYPTLEVDKIDRFTVCCNNIGLPSLNSAWAALQNVWRPFPWSERWHYVAFAAILLWRYRQRLNIIAFVSILLAGLAWMLGMSMFNVQRARHYFAVGAMLAMLYGCGLTVLYLFGQEAFSRLPLRIMPNRLRLLLAPIALLVVLANLVLPEYRKSEVLVQNYALPDRRNDVARYMDTSLPPGKFITDRANTAWGVFAVFNRAWGGYTGTHDFPVAQNIDELYSKPLKVWRANDAVYAIVPYTDDPDIYFPDETVLLKTYPPDSNFRGPDMAVLRLYPMQHTHGGTLGPIQLVGYDINAARLQAGEDLVFRHYWRAEMPTNSEHHVYNHLLDEAGEIVAQTDYVPLWDDRRDTTTWDDPDEIMLGREFTLSLPPDLAPGAYRLVSGLYDPETWQRLANSAGADGLPISSIEVSGF